MSLSAKVAIDSEWAAGYCATIQVTNTGTASATPGALKFRLAASVPITQSWNGTLSRDNDQVSVVLPSWVSPLAAGKSFKDFGFCAGKPAGVSGYLPTEPSVTPRAGAARAKKCRRGAKCDKRVTSRERARLRAKAKKGKVARGLGAAAQIGSRS